LGEYYKFHEEVPRMFIKKSTKVINSFHNRKRKLKYVEVKRMMGEPVELSDDNLSE
jgi:hypothetical protein